MTMPPNPSPELTTQLGRRLRLFWPDIWRSLTCRFGAVKGSYAGEIQPRIAASDLSVSLRSGSTTVGLCWANASTESLPVATATERAWTLRAQAMSAGVSPTTTIAGG